MLETTAITMKKEIGLSEANLVKRRIRRRWARVAWVYGILISIGCLLMGTFVVAILASLKDNPLEYPFKFQFAQINPVNWKAAWGLGQQGGNDAWLGGFEPGANIDFELTYFVPQGRSFDGPQITIPKRRAGIGASAVFGQDYAADYAEISSLEVINERSGDYEGKPGQYITYRFYVTYPGEGPRIDRVPLNSFVRDRNVKIASAELEWNRIERRGRVASWDDISPGVIGYVFKNYVRTFKESRSVETGRSLFLTWTFNSFLLGTAKVILTLLLSSIAGYALARMHFPGKTSLFVLIIFSMTMPVQVRFISNFLILRDLSLLNSMWGMIFSGADGGGFVGIAQVFIFKQFFESLPKSLEEAAFMDGASPATTFFRVVLPLAKPAMAAVTILTFQTVWNEFFWALVVLTSPADAYTLPIGLLSFRTAYGVAGDWGLILAGAFLSMIPILILFSVFQRYFVEGVSTAGIKG